MNMYDIEALAADLKLPEKYEVRTVRPTAVPPVLDGRITAEEWGDTPDFRIGREITGGKRTYCLDQFTGEGRLIPEIEYFWRYDDAYVYAALRVKEQELTAVSPNFTVTGADRSVCIQFGGTYLRAAHKDGEITDILGNVAGACAAEDGVLTFEFAAPREKVLGGKNGFLGSISYEIVFHYSRKDGSGGGFANCFTRMTPMYQNEAHSADVFVLAEGTPAPVPEITFREARSYSIPDVEIGGGYSLRFSDPTVLGQGDIGDQIWGHYNFPELKRLRDGSIVAGWSYHRDTIYESHDVSPRPTHSVSRDNGRTWEQGGEIRETAAQNLMPNGKYFVGFSGGCAYKTDYLDKYTPALTFGSGYKMFFAEDIGETKDKTVSAVEYDPANGQKTRFDVTVNWPYMPLVEFPGGYVYPVVQVFSLCNRSVITVDGVLYLPLYCHGFDSFAKSREDAVKPYSQKYSVFFFRSADSGRTWELLSQIMTDSCIENPAEGVCEPEMTVLPDGSFGMLMRTGSNNPSYIVRSADRGRTWSKPERFDSIGVLPQILSLPCGVTLASYGRPTMRFAASADPAAETWTKFDIRLTAGPGTSCYYTDLLPLDGTSALFIYTDTMYPNADGVPVRSVLVRTVTAVRK